MKKFSLLILLLISSFGFGFAFRAMMESKSDDVKAFKKVTGIGGIFFKCKDPGKLKEWYKNNLGLQTDKYGTNFVWYQGADSTKKGYTQWSPFVESTKYFGSEKQDFMINYRVDNLEALIREFKQTGVVMVDTMESYNYGKFIHILDNEGNKVELWEPVDEEYGKFEGGQTK
ncbi:MAG TPA: VOC family protein [Bacteroidia bacterium]|nr:VOC family protein [Bacteroidia bacterium]